MATYKSEAAAAMPQAQTRGGEFGDLLKATGIGALALGVLTGGVCLLAVGAVVWQAVLVVVLVPIGALGAGMLVYLQKRLTWALETWTRRDFDGDGWAGEPERVRLVPVNRRLVVNGCDAEDLNYFTRTAIGAGDWTQRRWRGVRMPSGRRCDNGYHAALLDCWQKAGIVADYSERSTGHLVIGDAQEALRKLGV